LGKYTPQTSISLRPRRTSLIAFSIVLVILVLLVLLPNPMTAVLQQQAAFQARITKQIAAIDHLRTALAHQAGLSAQQHTQIDQILRDLEAKLHTVHTETEAQQAIAEAQAKLDALRDPQALNKIQARSAASSSLQSSPNANLNAVGQALSTNDSKGLHAALQSLANQVSKMTPQQRAQLARQVEQVANQASQDPNLKAALHQLAKAIADGNPSEISDAINSVEEAASQNATAQAQSNSIDQVSQGLQQIADDLTSYTDGTNQQGQNQGQGKGQAQGQGQGQNQNQQQGNGQGQGNGGRGGSGGHGVGGGKGNDTGSKSGKNEQVSIPGQIGSGSSTQSNDGNNGVVQKGNSVPYTQVIEQYDQMAHDAIDNSSISPDLKDLVHGYFNTLEGQ
jgi:hypothetical protein